MHFALLFRGEAYRWGCDNAAMRRQHISIESHVTHLVQPLQALGHRVSLLLAYHCECSNAPNTLTLAANSSLLHNVGTSPNQAHAIARAMRWFRTVDAAVQHDALIVTRFDLTLRAPLHRWGCDPTNALELGVASRCKASAFSGWNCTNDILHVVPRRYLGIYSGALGAPRAPVSAGGGCCFHPNCVKAGGHGCFNALVSRGVPSDKIRFCFPQSQTLVSVLLPNDFFELSQCTDLPARSASQRPTFKGVDGTFRSGCERAGGSGPRVARST